MNNEVAFVSSLIESYPKSPKQLTFPFESDAEVIKIGPHYLSISQDTVCEEIDLGLIRNPSTLGWLTVISSLSDLAATGIKTDATSVVLGRPSSLSRDFETEFLAGVNAALITYDVRLDEYSVFESQNLITTCTAFATRTSPPPLTRLGLRENDVIYTTDTFGWGNAVALLNVMANKIDPLWAKKLDAEYRPAPRIKEALFINKWASTCIDSSDGALFTLSLLSELNQVGISFTYDDSFFHATALELARKTGVPTWLFFAAQNGEFELIFSVPATKNKDFLLACEAKSIHFLPLGVVNAGSGLTLRRQKKEIALDLSSIQNMLYEGKGPEQYVQGLLNFYQQYLKE
jgi:thiamine-monophosphate kinase